MALRPGVRSGQRPVADLVVLGVHHNLTMRLVERVVLEVAGPVAQYPRKLIRRITRNRFEVYFEVEGLGIRRFVPHDLDTIVE